MPKHILLSIRPKYIKEIISGEKQFEFRKKFPCTTDNTVSTKIIIYSSKPRMAIVGSFIIEKHLSHEFEQLMESIGANDAYVKRIGSYFADKKSCHALKISELKMYEHPLPLSYLRAKHNDFCPGQSYRYVDNSILMDIKSKNGYI
jgi:predicted transcriptional regulator